LRHPPDAAEATERLARPHPSFDGVHLQTDLVVASAAMIATSLFVAAAVDLSYRKTGVIGPFRF
jgi:hypothetical protein